MTVPEIGNGEVERMVNSVRKSAERTCVEAWLRCFISAGVDVLTGTAAAVALPVIVRELFSDAVLRCTVLAAAELGMDATVCGFVLCEDTAEAPRDGTPVANFWFNGHWWHLIHYFSKQTQIS